MIEREFAADGPVAGSVAGTIATSPRQLQRAFAENGGTSFRRELQRVRMERAATLLRFGSMPVAPGGGRRWATASPPSSRRRSGATTARPPSAFRDGSRRLAA